MKKIPALILSVILIFSYSFAAFADYENIYGNTGVNRDDIIEIAKTQIGYIPDGETNKYLIYSDADDDTWSGAFLAWCANEAKIDEDIIPQTASVSDLYDFFLDNEELNSNDDYTPSKGDIVFFETNGEITACGLVESCDGTYVTLISGDIDDAVQEQMYIVTAPAIASYATPAYEGTTVDDSSDNDSDTLTSENDNPDGTSTDDTETNDTQDNDSDDTDTPADNIENDNNDIADDDSTVIEGYITIAAHLNFRTGPSTSYDVITQIPLGTVLDITETSNGWGKTEYDGNTGWVSMNYIMKFTDAHVEDSEYAVRWNVLDLSRWQGDIDWTKIADTNVDAVIIRIGLRGAQSREIQIDANFEEYYQGAKEAGLHIGCYFYTTATTTAEATEEAEFVLETIIEGGYEFDMPIFLDIEDTITENVGKTEICDITESFLETLEDENFYTGVYCSIAWAEDYYTSDMFESRALWIADWRGECTYESDYQMWQYTSMGSIGGVESENTDLSICYIDFPSLIADNSYNILLAVSAEGNLGDINGDGNVSAADARLALRAAASLYTLTESEFTAADVDGNDKITTADARKILRVAAQLDTF